MSDDQELFSTSEAAEYLGLVTQTIKWHIYVRRDLKPDAKVGRTLVFTRKTLDDFQATRPKPGRPPKEGQATGQE